MSQTYFKPCTGILSDLHEHTKQFLTQNTPCNFENVRLHNRVTRWTAIDYAWLTFKNSNTSCAYILALFESNYYGDLAQYILCFWDYYHAQWVELTETFDDIYTCCVDLELI